MSHEPGANITAMLALLAVDWYQYACIVTKGAEDMRSDGAHCVDECRLPHDCNDCLGS
jgi:hypothetical protein